VDSHEDLSISRQCRLLALNRSSIYYKPAEESELNLKIMFEIDKKLIDTPEYGSRTLADILSMEWEIDINRKRVQRLMRIMGVEAVYPQKQTTFPGNASYIYPYLLRDLEINRPNQVWCTDITYLPMRGGYMYMVAIMDWYSRRILAWEISNTLDVEFCINALNKAVNLTGKVPDIFNTDQGSQFTSEKWITRLKESGIQISMDGKGRWVDNVLIERFWRTLKHNDVYLKLYDSIPELQQGVYTFIERYNRFRPHTALGRRVTPDMVYFGKKTVAVGKIRKAG
jgi:putative transposase